MATVAVDVEAMYAAARSLLVVSNRLADINLQGSNGFAAACGNPDLAATVNELTARWTALRDEIERAIAMIAGELGTGAERYALAEMQIAREMHR